MSRPASDRHNGASMKFGGTSNRKRSGWPRTGRPAGRGAVSRDRLFSASTRWGCSRTGPGRDLLLSIRQSPDRLESTTVELNRVATNPDLVVLFEHPEWQKPLFAALDRGGIAYEPYDLKR